MVDKRKHKAPETATSPVPPIARPMPGKAASREEVGAHEATGPELMRLDMKDYVREIAGSVGAFVASCHFVLGKICWGLDDRVTESANRFVQSFRALEHEWTLYTTPGPVKPAHDSWARAWSGLDMRLSAVLHVGSEDSEDAASIREILFPDGLDFTQGDYAAGWAGGEMRLQRIDSKGLASSMDRLTGPEFLALVRKRHLSLGLTLGLVQPKGQNGTQDALGELPEDVEVDLHSAWMSCRRCMMDYAQQVVTAHNGSVVLADREAYRLALKPIDDARDRLNTKGTTKTDDTPDPEPDPVADGTKEAKPAIPPVPSHLTPVA